MQIFMNMQQLTNPTEQNAGIGYVSGTASQKEEEAKPSEKKTISWNQDAMQNGNSLEAKRKEAQEKAKKVLQDAFGREQEINQGIADSQTLIKEKQTQIKNAETEIQELEAQKAQIRETCSEEEYQLAAKDINDRETELYKQINQAKGDLQGEIASIKDVKLDRLKSTNMRDAQSESEAIMEAAGDEILKEAGKQFQEHQEEIREEREEAAEKKEEAEAEKEERLEAAKENSLSYQQSPIQAATDSLYAFDQLKDSTRQELQEIIADYNLTDEDLKGTAVDKHL